MAATNRDRVRARSGGRCEARWDSACTGAGESLHHLVPRCRAGRNTEYNLLATCSHCHVEIHRPANEDEALTRGLIRHTRSNPARALARIIGIDAVAAMVNPTTNPNWSPT